MQVLDRMRSYPISNDPSGAEPGTESDEPTSRGKRGWSYAVRDVSWDSQVSKILLLGLTPKVINCYVLSATCPHECSMG